ncbi:MAG: hypothetical protein M3Z25_13430 [Actinomycetota bacterium]|nr:hypothetical protein [Actinomycetota bacterium]
MACASYRTSHDNQRAFLVALDTKMIAGGLATRDEAIFDLDFHAVMAWGADPALEKHYVPTRSQRSRSVLTFFAQDCGTHNLVYANADLSKATQNREVIAFCDHWKTASGNDPHMLVMDQKVTTQPVLAELDTVQRRFLETPGQITTTGDTITVRLNRRAHSPVLRQADLPNTTIPWWGNRTLHYQFA